MSRRARNAMRQPQREPIDQEELAWARECAEAGDTIQEIALWSGRTVFEWQDSLGLVDAARARLTERMQAVAAAHNAGMTWRQIGDLVGISATLAGQLVGQLMAQGIVTRRTSYFSPEGLANRRRILADRRAGSDARSA